MIVCEHKEAPRPRRQICVEYRALRYYRNDQEHISPRRPQVLRQHRRIPYRDAVKSAVSRPFQPATFRKRRQASKRGQYIGQRHQRHGYQKPFRDHLRILYFSRHIRDAFIPAVHPHAYTDAAAQSVYQTVTLRHERLHRIRVPVYEADRRHQCKCQDYHYGKRSAHLAYFFQPQQVHDRKDQDHPDLQRLYRCW